MNNIETLVLKVIAPNTNLAERHQAFNAIVLAFQDMAYACAYAVLGDFGLAEDAAQEAFITAWQKINQLRQPAAFPGWFRQILLTECNRLTRRRRIPTTSLIDGSSVASVVHDPQDKIERDELRDGVFAAIRKLPINERIAVTLFYLDERKQVEISEFLDVPMTTVAKRLYSARSRLRGTMMSRLKKDLSSRRPSRNSSFAEKVAGGLYDEYVGRYRFELRPELVVTIKREGQRLVSESGGMRNDLFAENETENELFAREFDGRGKFVRDKSGRISHLIYYEFGCEMGLAKKVS